MRNLKKLPPFLFFLFQFYSVNSQTVINGRVVRLNTITTAVPFVGIGSNAQANGSGMVGVVASDLYMQNGLDQNPALLSRGKKVMGIQLVNYSPWMRSAVPDINLVETGFHHSIGNNNAIGFSARNFSLGEITITDINGNVVGQYKPIEYYLNLCYAHNFSEHFSVGTSFKYIYSDLTGGMNGTHPGRAIAGDLGFDYRKYLMQKDSFSIKWNVGLSILNLGNKISYSNASTAKDFIPQTIKLGTLFTLRWLVGNNNYIAFDIAYQTGKLLVPSPPIYSRDATGSPVLNANGDYKIDKGMNPKVNAIQGAVQSFYDAPGGFSEEMKEIIHQFGIESRAVIADNKFLIAWRAGYFSESEIKGDRKFISTGLGFGFSGIRLDFSYWIAARARPLPNTVFINLGARFNLEKGNFFKFREN